MTARRGDAPGSAPGALAQIIRFRQPPPLYVKHIRATGRLAGLLVEAERLVDDFRWERLDPLTIAGTLARIGADAERLALTGDLVLEEGG